MSGESRRGALVPGMPVGERPARPSLEVALECRRLFMSPESDVGFDSPRHELRGMRDFTAIVFSETSPEIGGQARAGRDATRYAKRKRKTSPCQARLR